VAAKCKIYAGLPDTISIFNDFVRKETGDLDATSLLHHSSFIALYGSSCSCISKSAYQGAGRALFDGDVLLGYLCIVLVT